MTNKNELKAEMARHGDSCGELAKVLEMTAATFSKKLNGNADFTQGEIMIMKERYGLDAERVQVIFFAC